MSLSMFIISCFFIPVSTGINRREEEHTLICYVYKLQNLESTKVSDLLQWQLTKTMFNKQAWRMSVCFFLIRQWDAGQKKISCSHDWNLRHFCFTFVYVAVVSPCWSVNLMSVLLPVSNSGSLFPPACRSMSVSRSCWPWRSSWRGAL